MQDLEKWGAGKFKTPNNPRRTTYLLDEDGNSCCLGNIHRNESYFPALLFHGWPGAVCKIKPILGGIFVDFIDVSHKNNIFVEDAMAINDNNMTTPQRKMKQLVELFAEHGHQLEFLNQDTLPKFFEDGEN